ncbi:MAG TPA: hypothetical protein PK096_01835 [Candidatus Saccharibacteria bacterium]|nr:hypothetical protein [Candidatus Saccharibacteria bacterium]HRK94087.1 hypothetical protein [Candidatus Saccharibacteria bacterium]
MQRSSGARLFPLFIILIIIALVIAAIVSIGRAVFNSGSDTNSEDTSQTDVGRESLLKTDESRSVQMTVRGPIVADENFTSYRIEISPSERDMDVYKGYLEDRTNGKSLSNNTQAYEQFVFALDKANMMKGENSEDSEATDDLRGICATGYVYEFAVLEARSEVKRLWTSTCDGSPGSLQASKEQLADLFLAQVPGADDLIPFKRSPLLRL